MMKPTQLCDEPLFVENNTERLRLEVCGMWWVVLLW